VTKAIKLLKVFNILIVVFYAGYFALNAPVIIKAAKSRFLSNGESQSNGKVNADDTQTDVETIANAATASQSSSTSTTEKRKIAELKAKFKNDWLYYPKLGIEAPVEWDVQTKLTKQLLTDELVHIAGTGKPEVGGEALIAGHSSYYWWSKSKYKDVFAPLVNGTAGDNIVVKHKDTLYIYTVKNLSQTSSSASLEFKSGKSDPKKLTLMTCVPIGTNLKRLLVKADLAKEL